MFRRKNTVDGQLMKQRSNSTARLKSILFMHHTISRKDLIELSKLNPRTVSSCMQELARQNLVEVSRKVVSRGQPQIYYTLQKENIYFNFLVLTVVQSEIYALLCDTRGFPLAMHHQKFSSSDVKKMLPNLLFGTTRKISESLAEQGKKIYSIAVNLTNGIVFSTQFKNRIINMLQPYCSHNVICAYDDDFILSQYAINNSLSGRLLGLKTHNSYQHVATNGYIIDPASAQKVSKILDAVTDFSYDCKLLKLLDFNCFIKYLYGKYYSGLKQLGDSCYSETYSRALIGDLQARNILEDYAFLLGRSIIFLNRKIHFDSIVLMHSRPIIIEKVHQVLKQECAPEEKIPFITANFSHNEFIYVPAGYLRRELFSFEHGNFLPDLQNFNTNSYN